jgi:hypothetical protein
VPWLSFCIGESDPWPSLREEAIIVTENGSQALARLGGTGWEHDFDLTYRRVG